MGRKKSTEKYDNSRFYEAYERWLEDGNKQDWDIMWIEVNNCLMSQAKKKAKGIRIPEMDERIMDATIKAMVKITKKREEIRNLTNYLYFFVVDGLYNRKLQRQDKEISLEAWLEFEYRED